MRLFKHRRAIRWPHDARYGLSRNLQDSTGWLFPNQVTKNDAGKFVNSETNENVVLGRVEKMSKSKRNVVDPEAIIESYGADTARLFMLSDSPPERDLEWTEAGVDGAWRYLNRLWRSILEFNEHPFPKTSEISTAKKVTNSGG